MFLIGRIMGQRGIIMASEEVMFKVKFAYPYFHEKC